MVDTGYRETAHDCCDNPGLGVEPSGQSAAARRHVYGY
jgi:hypothetical protein